MHNETNLPWVEAVLHVLGDHYPGGASFRAIYVEVKKYRKLVDADLEVTEYGEPRYHLVVRATLEYIRKEGRRKKGTIAPLYKDLLDE